MLKVTRDLIRIVERQASHEQTWIIAQQLLQQGADVTALTNNGSMIHSAIAEKERYEQTIPWKAKNCHNLIQVLANAASMSLATEILSKEEPNFNLLKYLVDLKASCYQPEQYGPLGLLGTLIKLEEYPIRLDVVQFLITSDISVRLSLTMVDTQQQTCLSLAKQNRKCTQSVIDYLQNQLDMILNKVAYEQPSIDPNEVLLWICRGANSEVFDEHQNTALTNAVLANNLALVRALVSTGSNTVHRNAENQTPIEIAKAAIPKNPALITILEAQSVNNALRSLIETKKSMLTMGDIQTLLEDGASINMPLANNHSFLHLLVTNQGSPTMISSFLNDLNADLSVINIHGYRPMELCILSDDENCARLLAFLHSPKLTNDLFMNPRLKMNLLDFAIEQNRNDIVKILQNELNLRLWKSMIRVNPHEDNYQMILEDMNQLVMAGAQIDCVCPEQGYEHRSWTILHVACKNTNRSFVEYLVRDLKANYQLQTQNGDYPISIAAEYGQLLVLNYLFKLPYSSLNVYNKEKETPLHLASKNYHLLVVQYLIRWGADHQAVNTSKQTPLDVARANTRMSKEEEITNRQLINFLEPLTKSFPEKPVAFDSSCDESIYKLETCEFVSLPHINPIQVSSEDAEASFVRWNKGIFTVNPNKNLHAAAKIGAVYVAKQAIGHGADIRPQKNHHAPYEVAIASMNEYIHKLNSRSLVNFEDPVDLQKMIQGCQEIANIIQNIAYNKILEAIKQSNTSLCVVYHHAGAPVTLDLLYAACASSDNVEIVDYLISRNKDIYYAMINNTSNENLYRIAKRNKFMKVANYLKHRLSMDCVQAVNNNDFILTKNLVNAGASVDMENTNNLKQAIQHQNPDLIEFLCQHGAKISPVWLNPEGIVLDTSTTQDWKPEVAVCLNRCLINRRLRLAAAKGDLRQLNLCLKLGADINSTNCHGATALLYAIQHGDYFSIVYTLISRGASMLHSNKMEPMSLIDLAKKLEYNDIVEYLLTELNRQFLSAIINNDRSSAEKFAQLGADFNHQDDQQRTPLHYAVQYYNVDLVQWLCECGSTPTICDSNGDYPIIQATEKGDYAIVEFFITKYPATKRQVNKASLTALQIAQKLKYNRIAELIETGKAVPEPAVDKQTTSNSVKYNPEKLRAASRNGHIKMIKEFVEQRYESKEEKKRLCEELITIAKDVKQYQILEILEPYYTKTLRRQLASDVEVGDGNIRLQDKHRQILLGLLTGLSDLILDSPTIIDPDNPNTYRLLFSGLISRTEKRSDELRKITNDQDVKRLNDSDTNDTHERLVKINHQLEQLIENRDSLQIRVEDAEDRIFKQEKLSALQRKKFIEEREALKRQLATYECSIFLYQRQLEATIVRQNTIDFIKDNSNLALFYHTIENRLEALFHSALAAQGGYLTTKMHSMINSFPKKNLLVKLPTSTIKAVLNPILSKLDAHKQKKEWHNISTLGNIEELGRIAADTAGLITLYYREQIQLIDPMQTSSDNSADIAVVLVAEYITEWVIEALKRGESDTGLNESVPRQLWLFVAKFNPIHLETASKSLHAFDLSSGKEKIPLKVIDAMGIHSKKYIQLRYLIGCVSLIDGDGHIYRYQLSKRSSDLTNDDLDMIGYVYLKPFSSDVKTVQLIIDSRRLVHITDDYSGMVQKRFDDVAKHSQAYIQGDVTNATDSAITKQTIKQVAEILCQQKVFIESNEFQEKLNTLHESFELSMDVLKEELREKTSFYQISIDAAHEQLQEESKKNRETMKKDNETRYDEIWKRLSDNLKNVEMHLQTTIEQQMNSIQEKIEKRFEQILTNVEQTHMQSFQALAQAEKANEQSQKSIEKSRQAVDYVDNLNKKIEKQHEQFNLIVKNFDTTWKQTVAQQKESYGHALEESQTRTEISLKHAEESVQQSARHAQESARFIEVMSSNVHEIQQTTKAQLQIQKKESEKMLLEAREAHERSQRAVDVAREAEREAKRASDAQLASLTKMNQLCEKLEKLLERIDKLSRKIES